jgi:hypothetical protein
MDRDATETITTFEEADADAIISILPYNGNESISATEEEMVSAS